MSLGPWEIVLIILAIILIFGGKKIPELARGLGKGLNEFKKAKKEIKDEVESVKEDQWNFQLDDIAIISENSSNECNESKKLLRGNAFIVAAGFGASDCKNN